MGELTKLHNAGKIGPGPMYGYKDEIKYSQVRNISHINDKRLFFSHQVGHLELLNVKALTSLNMTSMKMLPSWMIL